MAHDDSPPPNGYADLAQDFSTRGITHPILPKDIELSYLNEGAANIVYRISAKEGTPLSSVVDSYGEGTPPPSEVEFEDTQSPPLVFDNKLLRLRKDLPTTAPSSEAEEHWVRLIQPLFNSEEVVDQVLVQIPSKDIIQSLNRDLVKWEGGNVNKPVGPRPTKRCGTYLAEDNYGLLVTDMTPRTPGQELIEFKPKWLLQSPSAPRNSQRCRTCALTARQNAKSKRLGEPLKEGFCPLDLVSKNARDLLLVTEKLLGSEPNHSSLERFSKWLHSTDLLHRLRKIQSDMDPTGALQADTEGENFRIAMTLRDCTVFVRFPEDPEQDRTGVEARLGDLDLKSKDKAVYWKSVETQLIDEGWYEGIERAEDRQPLICSISRP